MKITVDSSYFADLSREHRAEAEQDLQALGVHIIGDDEHLARMEAAQQTVRMGVFQGFMERVRGGAA